MKWAHPQNTELTTKSLIEFVKAQQRNEIKPKIKSEPKPASNNGPVIIVTGDTFNEIVMDKTKNVFVNFYAPWCIWCQKLAPVWEDLGRANLFPDDNIVIAKMDATANDIPPEIKYQIDGFPTITLFKAGSNEIDEKHTGKRTLPGT